MIANYEMKNEVNSIEGAVIAALNSCKGNGKLNIDSGNSEQESREGYNLATDYTSETNSTQYTNIYYTNERIKTSKTYTMSFKGKPGDKYRTTSGNYGIATESKVVTVDSNGVGLVTFTTKDEFTATTIGILNNYSQNNTLPITDICIAEGTFEELPFEEYGASPSPEYPSRIRNVGDNVNLSNNSFEVAEYNTSGNKINTTVWVVNTNKINVKPNTIYTVSQAETTSQYRIICFNNDTYISRINTTQNTTTGYKTFTFTTPENCNKIYIQLRSTIELINSGTYDMSTNSITKFKLEKGSKATPYTPYGCGSVDVKVQNKNILKGLSTSIEDIEYWYDINKYYFTPLENGWGKFSYDNTNGTSTIFINAKVKLSSIDLKPNTQYTIVTEIRNSEISKNSGAYLQLCTTNAGSSYAAGNSINYQNINEGGIFKRLVKTKEDLTGIETGLDTYLRLSAGTKGTVEARISIIEGDYDISNFKYVKHEEQTITFPLEQGQVLHEGDYLAEDGIHQIRNTYTYDGSSDENWFIGPNNTYFRGPGVPNIKNSIPNINNYKTTVGNIAYIALDNQTGYGFAFAYGARISFENMSPRNGNTVEDLREYLTENPIEMEYELAEEIVIPYTPEQQEAYNKLQHLAMYDELTYVSCLNDLQPEMSLEYLLNTNEVNELYSERISKLENDILFNIPESKKGVSLWTGSVLAELITLSDVPSNYRYFLVKTDSNYSVVISALLGASTMAGRSVIENSEHIKYEVYFYIDVFDNVNNKIRFTPTYEFKNGSYNKTVKVTEIIGYK